MNKYAITLRGYIFQVYEADFDKAWAEVKRLYKRVFEEELSDEFKSNLQEGRL